MLKEYYEKKIETLEQTILQIDKSISEYTNKLNSENINNGLSLSPRNGLDKYEISAELNVGHLIIQEKIKQAQHRRTSVLNEIEQYRTFIETIDESDDMEQTEYDDSESESLKNDDSVINEDIYKFLQEEKKKIDLSLTMFSTNRNKAKSIMKEIKNDFEGVLAEITEPKEND